MLDISKALDVKALWTGDDIICCLRVVEVNINVLTELVRCAREQSTIFWFDRKIWDVVADCSSH